MNNVLAAVERGMTLEAIFNNFMIDLDFDSKHGSVGGQACDVILHLVAPEFHHLELLRIFYQVPDRQIC